MEAPGRWHRLAELGAHNIQDLGLDMEARIAGTLRPEGVWFHFAAGIECDREFGWIELRREETRAGMDESPVLWYDSFEQASQQGRTMNDDRTIEEFSRFIASWRTGEPGKPYPPYVRKEKLEALGLSLVNDWQTWEPTQITARIEPEGRWFYFRASDGGASIEIYEQEPVDDKTRKPLWCGECRCSRAIPIEDDELVGLVGDFLRRWRAGDAGEGGPR